MTTNLNFEYLNARKLVIPTVDNINLVLIGCGGTGSWLAPAVVRYARLLIEKFDRDVKVVLIDPDQVELKNVYRQNFSEAEIGANKADALAFRYGLAWGMSITAMSCPFTASIQLPVVNYPDQALTILIGCVDNTAARREIEKRIYKYRQGREIVWWLDCGNKKSTGQVLIGRAPEKGENPLTFDGLSTWAPLPSVQHPDLVDVQDIEIKDLDEDSNLSCAELAMRGSQSLSINFRMAAIAGEMLGKFLLTNDLEYFAAYIDQATGETRKFVTCEAIESYVEKETISKQTGNDDDEDAGDLDDLEDDEE